MPEMQEVLKISHNTVERNLKVLRKMEYVERVGARKDGSRIVKI